MHDPLSSAGMPLQFMLVQAFIRTPFESLSISRGMQQSLWLETNATPTDPIFPPLPASHPRVGVITQTDACSDNSEAGGPSVVERMGAYT